MAVTATTCRANIQCANCRAFGHVSRVCPQPVSSFGIMCYRVRDDDLSEYLMVQRKDSLCYVEFMLGKYRLENDAYLQTLVSNMTSAEQERLSSNMAFEDLWKDLWQVSSTCGSYMKEYYDAHRKFHVLRAAGTLARLLREAATHDGVHPPFDEPEWGFPKGRRNLTETDVECALREFTEETGLQASSIDMVKELGQHEETFTGTNGVRYRHVYYIARLASSAAPALPQLSSSQKREIRQTAWWPYAEAQKRIRPQNVERRQLFARVHGELVSVSSRPAASPRAPRPESLE